MKAHALAGSLFVFVLASACSGGAEGGPIPQIAEAHAERQVTSDGVARLATTVTVRFDRDFKLVHSDIPLSSNFELAVPDPQHGPGATTRVLVDKAGLDAATRTVTFTVNALIADGSKLKVAKRAFQPNAEGDLEFDIESDLNNVDVVLATTALGALEGPLLADPITPEVTPADRDPVAQRAALQAHLARRGADETTTKSALARYDAMPASVIPSPKARAALAALTGAFAEPAIDALLTSANCTNKPVQAILFQSPPDAPQLLARVTFAEGARILSLNPVLEGDRLERIMPVLAHEAIHCDRTDTRTEEVIATSVDTFLYMQLVAADPTLAAGATPASREFNLDAMALINSGRRLPESIGILPSAGITRALPGTTSTFGSFAELVSNAYANVDTGISPHEAVADAYIARLAPLAHMPAQTGFDVKYMDELLGRAMSQSTLAAVIQAFGLEPVS